MADETTKILDPSLNYSIGIRNLYIYRDFLRKRPRRAQQFKFSMIQSEQRFPQAETRQLQSKLLKALKVIKQAIKVDLSGCKIHGKSKVQVLSVLKRISNIQTLSGMNPRSDFRVKYLGYFPRLAHIIYRLNGSHLIDMEFLDAHKFLENIKYCPKMNAVDFTKFIGVLHFTKFDSRPKRYLRFLDQLIIRSKHWNGKQYDFPVEACENLKSISFKFFNLHTLKQLTQIMNGLQQLSNLQEIALSFINNPTADFVEALERLAKKRILKKVSFNFKSRSEMLNLSQILECLKLCNLTSFSLHTFIQEKLLKSISDFLPSMSDLEALELSICNLNLYSKDNSFIEMCENISKLQELRNLKLDFPTFMEVSTDSRISNFIPCLSGTFTKPIKVETFHIKCNQLGPSGALESVMDRLENSAGFLTHLKIDFEGLACIDRIYLLIFHLMKKLRNIQVLEIPCLR